MPALKRYLYSCYSYLPKSNDGAMSLDLCTGDEIITSFEHEPFANIPKGNYTAAKPIISYWNTLFAGIRQCYMLKEGIHQVPDVDENTVKDYIAQADFLIAYYHLLLMRCYGPIILVKELPDINTSPDKYAARSTLKETVEFISNKFQEASEALPKKRTEGPDVGLATSVAALSLKAYTLMYYASPLFNGNDICKKYSLQMINPDGTALMDGNEDRERWVVARDAYKKAIDAAIDAGHDLYKIENPKMANVYPENDRLRLLRSNLVTIVKYNPEEIWTLNNNEGPWGLQNKSLPYVYNRCFNGLSPTLNMLNRFYTKNGLPYDVDPETKDLNMFDVVSLDSENSRITFYDGSEAVIAEEGGKTSQLNLLREPRYYAWIAFHNGFYELTNASTNGAFSDDPSIQKYENKQMVSNFLNSGNCGRGGRDDGYAPSGFLNKKGVHPDNIISKSGSSLKIYPWPIVRLAELYLGYAECCAEVGTEADVLEAKKYLNKVRDRAGIPDVDTSWNKVDGVRDAQHLRDIVRKERQIEMYLENQNFWDMRRWGLADKYFGHKHSGMNTLADDIDDFSKKTEIPFLRDFQEYNWLLPIPSEDIYNNQNLIQNPGY